MFHEEKDDKDGLDGLGDDSRHAHRGDIVAIGIHMEANDEKKIEGHVKDSTGQQSV